MLQAFAYEKAAGCVRLSGPVNLEETHSSRNVYSRFEIRKYGRMYVTNSSGRRDLNARPPAPKLFQCLSL